MANMGLDRLILVEPAAVIGKIGNAFAVGARPILDNAESAPPAASPRRSPPSAG